MSEATFQVISTGPLVAMFTAPNPSPKTLSGTHSFVVGEGKAYIVDPGPAIPAYQEAMADWIRERGIVPSAVLVTHGHPDHAPGATSLAQLFSIPVMASELMPMDQAWALGVSERFRNGETFPIDGDVVEIIGTPGHTPDHVALWLGRARILLAGDLILGEGSTLVAPPEGDMAAYMQSLETVRALRPELIAPGHGPLVRRPAAKIDEYVAHRRQREEQLLAALEEGPATVPELVRRIYTDVDPRLHGLAEGSVLAQLKKLEVEGRAEQSGETFKLIVPRP